MSARYSGVSRSLVVTWRVSGSKRQAMMVEKLTAHLGPVGEADAWVFTADKGGVLRPSNFRVKVWLPAVRAAGPAPLRPHDLRHTAVELRDRLDVMHAQGLRAVSGGAVVELPAAPARPAAAPARPTANQAMRKARRGSGPELK